ncbi:GGDEF domain-containing protein [Occallatibacter savannae]|uniref:GGDEF domain-containing protein n=1 Tax=Occallatibacter savannae TaxID=1002691 RepID=UPI0013A5B599|nr:GGDEF domain-containing protein [Occallatibacter savannae]
MRKTTKLWIAIAIALTFAQFAGSALLPRGVALSAVSDIASSLLFLALIIAFGRNAVPTHGRLRVFWVMQCIGWSVFLVNQLWWMYYDVVLNKQVPMLFAGDILMFIPGLLMLSGFLLRPHLQQSPHRARLGAVDFLLLVLWWVFLYAYLVFCWQYVSPNEFLYNRNYDNLYLAEIIVVLGVLTQLIRYSAGHWRRFYLFYGFGILFNYAWFAIENRAIEKYAYFVGSWYDGPYLASWAFFLVLAALGASLRLDRESDEHERDRSWITALSIIAVLSLPIMVVFAIFEPGASLSIIHFRVLVTALAMFAMAGLVFLKQQILHLELRHSNLVLQWSSTTDPLTGTRNRRFFFENIQRDIAQSVRAHLESGDSAERDIVFYLIDLDNFKKVNDRFGHDGGDRMLIESARRISSAIRNSDLLVRWGGEEFLVVSRYTDRNQAAILANRILNAFRTKPFQIDSAEPTIQTCSIGWAAFPWHENDIRAINYEGVLKYADRALYRAKKAGKNQAIGMVRSDEGANPVTISDSISESLIQSANLDQDKLLESPK